MPRLTDGKTERRYHRHSRHRSFMEQILEWTSSFHVNAGSLVVLRFHVDFLRRSHQTPSLLRHKPDTFVWRATLSIALV